MLFWTQFSGLIVSLGLDPSWFWLLLPLPLPVPEVSTVQVLALRTLPIMRCLLGDTFLGRFIPRELCPLIHYHVLLIPHILDLNKWGLTLVSNSSFPKLCSMEKPEKCSFGTNDGRVCYLPNRELMFLIAQDWRRESRSGIQSSLYCHFPDGHGRIPLLSGSSFPVAK